MEEIIGEMKEGWSKNHYVVEYSKKIGQKLTIKENLTFHDFWSSVEYIQLQNMTSPNSFYVALSDKKQLAD